MTNLGEFVRVSVYEPDATTLIAHLPRRRGVQWLNEMNSPGSGQFDMLLDDELLLLHPDMLNYFNVVKFYLGEVPVKAWLIESVQPVQAAQGEGADRWITVSGRGPMSCLEAAIVYPEYLLSAIFSTTRFFNFASGVPIWYNSSDWVAPVGWKFAPTPFTRWSGYPSRTESGAKFKWPDKNAYWIWYPDPDESSNKMTPGTVWFRSTWTNTEPVDIVVMATADNALTQLYFDGQIITGSAGKAAYKTVWKKRIYNVQAGTHTIAAMCKNFASFATETVKPAGYIMAIYSLDEAGNRNSDGLLFHTDPTDTFTVCTGYDKPVSNPKLGPGWHAANILQQLIIDAQTPPRSVDCLKPVTFGFDNVLDSASVAWDDIQQSGVQVGSSTLADIATQMVELACDIDFDPNFVMHAWKRRGTDRSSTVRIIPARNASATTAQGQGQRIRNQALVLYNGSMIEMYAPVSKTTYGRREVGISVGTANDKNQAENVGKAALLEIAAPEETVTASITSLAGPQPFQDFDLGDSIMHPSVFPTPGTYTTLAKGRVMSIAASEQSEGYIQYDLSFYPDVDDESVTFVDTSVTETHYSISEAYAAEVKSDSPWGYWRMTGDGGLDGTFEDGFVFDDSSGSEFGALLQVYSGDEPVARQTAPIKYGVKFGTGTTGLPVVFPGTTAGTTLTGSHLFNYVDATVECWVKIHANPSGNPVPVMGLAAAHGATSNPQFSLLVGTGGHAIFRFTDKSGAVHNLTSLNTLDFDTWYYLAGVFKSGGTQRLYVFKDGAGTVIKEISLDSSGIQAKLDPNGGWNVLLRGAAYDNLSPSTITIAEPAIYYQALPETRLLVHFNCMYGQG